jgi:acyl carrier protein
MTSDDGSDVRGRVLSLVAEVMGHDGEVGDIRTDVPIFRGGLGLDSMSAVELLEQIESTFDIYVDDDDFEIFDSIDRLVAYVIANAPDRRG